MKVKFNRNQLKIINLLENVKNFKSVKEISEEVNISERSIYKNLNLINEKLKSMQIEGTRNIYGQGYYLSNESKLAIKNYFANSNGFKNEYNFEEREYLEYLELFINGKLSIQSFVENNGFSKQTILKDIVDLKQKLNQFKISIVSNNKGHFLKGSETQIRHFLFLSLYSNKKLSSIYESKEIRELRTLISRWLNSFGNSNNIIYSDEFIYVFETFYSLTLERIFNGHSNNDKVSINKNITTTAEYKFANSFLPILLGDKFDKFEIYYLTTILLGGQKRKISKNSISQDIDHITCSLISNFKNLADCEFKNEKQLYEDLVIHLSTTFFRVKYRQQYQNSSFELIKKNYPDIYIYTQMSIHPFERLIGASLNDYEVGLISTYFASQIASKKTDTQSEVLLISSGSNGSSRFLLTQLVEQYPYVNFSLPISDSELRQKDDIQEKVIITTVSLKNVQKPFLKVNSVLTSNDLRNIDNLFQINGIATTANFQTEYKAIMETISDNTKIVNNAALENGIKQILLTRKKHKKIKKRMEPLLSEILTEDMIKFSSDKSLNWETAIALSAKPLLDSGKITHKYVDAIIKNVKDNGPYINIGTEIALAHARPNQGVNQLGMSLLLLDHDINLVDSKHRIRLIIVLAASDTTSHLKALSELAQILGDKEEVSEIMHAKNANDIENLIKKGEQK